MLQISFDMSLARGLDYYTGIIYEAVTEASAPPGFNAANAFAASSSQPSTANTEPPAAHKRKAKKSHNEEDEEEEVDESQVGVGSIAAGGRYDNLVGLFTAAASAEGKKVQNLPCVGVSFGMDRVFAIIWPKWVERGMRSKDTMAYVLAAGDGLLKERVELVRELRDVGIKVSLLCLLAVILVADPCSRIPDRLSVQEKAKTPRTVCRWRERRGSIRHHPWRRRVETGLGHCQGAEVGSRRRREEEDPVERPGCQGQACGAD